MGVFRRIRDSIAADPRLARVLHGGASALLSRAVLVGVNLILLPLTLRYLGPVRFGIWATVSALVAMLAVLDLGLANTLTNLISRAYAARDNEAAARYYATAFWASVALAATLTLLAAATWKMLPFDRLFALHGEHLEQEVTACCSVALAYFLLGLPLNLVHRLLAGEQQTQLTNYARTAGSLLSLLAVLCVIALHGGLVPMFAAYSLALLLPVAALHLWVTRLRTARLTPYLRTADPGALRALLPEGMRFFVLQLSGLVVFNADNVVIGHWLGPAAVTPYSVTWRIAGYAALLHTTLGPSLWPAYAEAYARGDMAWVRCTFWRTVHGVLPAALAFVLVLLFAGRPLIGWYAGPAAVPDGALLAAVCAWTLLSTVMDVEAVLLAATGRIRVMSWLSVAAAALNLALSIVWVQRIGSVGVVLGTIVSYVLLLVVPQAVITYRVLYRPTPSTNGDVR